MELAQIGSQLSTPPTGGKFDGAYGVMIGLTKKLSPT
jgi:hypothetical protein